MTPSDQDGSKTISRSNQPLGDHKILRQKFQDQTVQTWAAEVLELDDDGVEQNLYGLNLLYDSIVASATGQSGFEIDCTLFFDPISYETISNLGTAIWRKRTGKSFFKTNRISAIPEDFAIEGIPTLVLFPRSDDRRPFAVGVSYPGLIIMRLFQFISVSLDY